MNIDNNLVLVKGEDKTSAIISWEFDKNKHVIYITFSNHKAYPYNASQVQFLKDPEVVVLNDCIALKDGVPLYGVEKLQYFDGYCRIVYKKKNDRIGLSV